MAVTRINSKMHGMKGEQGEAHSAYNLMDGPLQALL